MPPRQTLPAIWLISDKRNDAILLDVLARLPRGSGFVYRHYHLAEETRRARFRECAELCARVGHIAALSGTDADALNWGADAVYGPPARLGSDPVLLKLATVHDAAQVDEANAAKADAVFVSPVFPTLSHPDASPLGERGFSDLAARAEAPAIALGGMTAERARAIGARRWAAIDGLR